MATIFRPPIIVTISPRRKAADGWTVNLRVLYAPNPAVPFNQLDWPLATRAKAKAVGEAIAAPSPLYNPNPAQPFKQSDWLNAARARAPKSSDAPAYFIPPKPFTEPSWAPAQRSRFTAKVDDVVNLLPVQTPIVVVAAPFAEFSWPPPQRSRAAKVDDVVNLVPLQNPVVVVAAPFKQTDWPLAAASRKPALVDTVELLLPLYAPGTPFAGLTETRIMARRAVKSDIFVNLVPLQAAPVVLPFSLKDWSTVARPRLPTKVDLIERSAPLYTPNPDRPFINPIMMNSNASRRRGAIVDAFVNLLPPQAPPVSGQPIRPRYHGTPGASGHPIFGRGW